MKKLNLGCGDDILIGYDNCDIFPCQPSVIQADILNLRGIPSDNYAEIKCCMVLEHVHIDLVPTALYQISRVLAPGGFVDITVPDFDYFVQKYLNNKGKLTKTMNFHNFYNITYNLLAPEIDPKIRTHQALFTEEFLTILLVDDGFVNVETVRKAGGILTVWAFKHDGSSSTLKYDTSTERENE